MPPSLSLNTFKNFDWETYRLNYPELADQLPTEQDALLHYVYAGRMENRNYQIPTIFDWEKYSNAYRHLCLNTPRETYLHFMRLGLKYKQEKTNTPLAMLILAQYEKIIAHNQSSLNTSGQPFNLPSRPKNQTTPPEYRQPQTPNVLNPPKEPLKKPRPDSTIADRLQAKVVAPSAPVRQQIKSAANSILQPARTQDPVPQPRLSEWPPRQTEQKRPPQAPPILHPLQKPSRSGIIRTDPKAATNRTTAITVRAVGPPPERRRPSHAPTALQPLQKPSRSTIIKTKATEDLARPPVPAPTPRKQPLPLAPPPRPKRQPPPPRPREQPSVPPLIGTKPPIPSKPRLYVKPAVATRLSQKLMSTNRYPIPFWYLPKRTVCRQPREGELILKEQPPSKYFTLLPPKYLN